MQKGKLTEAERDEKPAAPALHFTTTLADFDDRDMVIEAVAEDEGLKLKLFAELDKVVADPEAILASNTSTIPIVKIAAATKSPQRVLGLHFFNPVPVLTLVELVNPLLTTEATVARGRGVRRRTAGQEGHPGQDRSGFMVNALLVPYLLSAIRMPEAGLASVEDIDKAMVRGSAPDGPAEAVRSGRLGHPEAHRGLDVRRIRGTPLCGAAAAAADARGRSDGQEVREGLLHLLMCPPETATVFAHGHWQCYVDNVVCLACSAVSRQPAEHKQRVLN